MKAINVKDETDSIRVSLWRDLAESSFVGKYVEMTNLIVTAFNDEVSVSSTSRTDLKVNKSIYNHIENFKKISSRYMYLQPEGNMSIYNHIENFLSTEKN